MWCFPGQLGVIYDSQVTDRRMTGEGGGSHSESSLLPIGCLGVIYDSQSHGYALYVAIGLELIIMLILPSTRPNVAVYKGSSEIEAEINGSN